VRSCAFHGYRIIEIEWAVKNNKEFVPSPKPPRKAKKKKGKAAPMVDDTAMDVDDQNELKLGSRRRERAEFGLELTNAGMDSPTKGKRPLEAQEGEDDAETPPKRQRRGEKAMAVVSEQR